MNRKHICSWCRSDLEAQGTHSFSAPSVTRVRCPVCNAPQFLDGGFPFQTIWESFKIIVRREPVRPWNGTSEVQKNIAAIPKEFDESVLKDFKIVPDNLKSLLGGTAIYVVIVLVLIAFIVYNKK